MPDENIPAEQDRTEFAGWFEAQGYPSPEDRYDGDEMAAAFAAGMAAGKPHWTKRFGPVVACDHVEPQPAPGLRALLDHETRLTWQSGLPGERARVAVVRESAGLEAL